MANTTMIPSQRFLGYDKCHRGVCHRQVAGVLK